MTAGFIGTFNFGTAVFGVDPATRIVGVCLMLGNGEVVRTWSLRAEGEPLERLSKIHGVIRRLFNSIWTDEKLKEKLGGAIPMVLVEEGIFGGGKEPMAGMPRNAALAGEVRGVVCAEAWRHGWRVKKIAVMSWKTLLTKDERKMKKNREYVAYFNSKLKLECVSPDEVDAVMIASYGVFGKKV